MRTAVMTRVALMAAVVAVAAQISVPLPFSPVPFTMGVLAVILSGFVLGPRYGALALVVYLLIGAVGVPVFANFTGGLGRIVGPTGGYLISYPFAAAIAGLAAGVFTSGRQRRGRAIASGTAFGLLGLVVIYALGAAWLSVQAGLSAGEAFAAGVLPFIPFDILKVVLAALLAAAVAPQLSPIAVRRTS